MKNESIYKRGISGIIVILTIIVLAMVAIGAWYYLGQSSTTSILPGTSTQTNVAPPGNTSSGEGQGSTEVGSPEVSMEVSETEVMETEQPEVPEAPEATLDDLATRMEAFVAAFDGLTPVPISDSTNLESVSLNANTIAYIYTITQAGFDELGDSAQTLLTDSSCAYSEINDFVTRGATVTHTYNVTGGATEMFTVTSCI